MVSVFDLEFQNHGDEFLVRLGKELEQRSDGTRILGHTFSNETSPFLELRLHDNVTNSPAVLYLGTADGQTILALDPDRQPSDDLCSTVTISAERAVELLGGPDSSFTWLAMIGPPLASMSQPPSVREESTVGTMKISPGDCRFLEIVHPSEHPSLHSYGVSQFFPIMVQGVSTGYSWSVASIAAARELNQLCAILSVSWRLPVTIREAPFVFPLNAKPVVPRSAIEDLPNNSVPAATPTFKTVPPWATSALRLVQRRQRIADALAAHHQGLLLMREHPSMALVAFIAAVEAISQIIFREEKCTTCPNHIRVSEKFRETLKLVTDGDLWNALASTYGPRSKTVHRGRLQGGELTFGSLNFDLFSEHAAQKYQWRNGLSSLWFASEKLMLMALTEKLPPKRALPPTRSQGPQGWPGCSR